MRIAAVRAYHRCAGNGLVSNLVYCLGVALDAKPCHCRGLVHPASISTNRHINFKSVTMKYGAGGRLTVEG
jgi:hypothetical protein